MVAPFALSALRTHFRDVPADRQDTSVPCAIVWATDRPAESEVAHVVRQLPDQSGS